MEKFISWIESELVRVIRDRRWFDKNRDTVVEVKIHDYLCLENKEDVKGFLFIVRVAVADDSQFYAVAIEARHGPEVKGLPDSIALLGERHRWRLSESSYAAGFNRVLLHRMAEAKRRLITANGNYLIFEQNRPEAGCLNRIDRCIPFEPDKSSNCLNYIEAGGRKYLHKFYKRLDINNHEIVAFQKIGASDGGIPAVIGAYFYQDRQNGSLFPLGMVMEFLEGNSIDKELNGNIRSLWDDPAVFQAGSEAGKGIIREHIQPLSPLLEGIAKRLSRFHQLINGILNVGQNDEPFCLSRYLHCCRSRLERVAGLVRRDGHAVRKEMDWIGRLLTQYRDTHFAETQYAGMSGFLPGFCHGDLHLSNLLYKYNDGSYHDVKIVDFAPRGIDIAPEQFLTQSPLQDLVAIQRGLEYFSFEEANREIARTLGISEPVASRWQFLSLVPNAISGGIPCSLPTEAASRIRRINRIARCWKVLLFECIWRSYFEDPGIDRYYCRSRSPGVVVRMWNLFYLSRLLKELAYNYDYRRDDFKNVDFYYLARLSHQSPGQTLRAKFEVV